MSRSCDALCRRLASLTADTRDTRTAPKRAYSYVAFERSGHPPSDGWLWGWRRNAPTLPKLSQAPREYVSLTGFLRTQIILLVALGWGRGRRELYLVLRRVEERYRPQW